MEETIKDRYEIKKVEFATEDLKKLNRQQRIELYKKAQESNRKIEKVDIVLSESDKLYIKTICKKITNLIHIEKGIIYLPDIQKMPYVNFDKIYSLLEELSSFIKEKSNYKYDTFHLLENEDISALRKTIFFYHNHNLWDYMIKKGLKDRIDDFTYEVYNPKFLHLLLKNGVYPNNIKIKTTNLKYFKQCLALLIDAGLDINKSGLVEYFWNEIYKNNREYHEERKSPYCVQGRHDTLGCMGKVLYGAVSLLKICILFGGDLNTVVKYGDKDISLKQALSQALTSGDFDSWAYDAINRNMREIGILPLEKTYIKKMIFFKKVVYKNVDDEQLLADCREKILYKTNKIIINSELDRENSERNLVSKAKKYYSKIKKSVDEKIALGQNVFYHCGRYLDANKEEIIFKNISLFDKNNVVEYDASTNNFSRLIIGGQQMLVFAKNKKGEVQGTIKEYETGGRGDNHIIYPKHAYKYSETEKNPYDDEDYWKKKLADLDYDFDYE